MLENNTFKVLQDMFDGCSASIKTLIGSMDSFEVNVASKSSPLVDAV